MSTKPGNQLTIVGGAFAGLPAVFVRDAGTKVVVEVTVFGRTTEATLAREDVVVGAQTLEDLEAQVVNAVRQREFPQRLFSFWRRALVGRAVDPSDDELPELARRAEAWEAQQRRALDQQVADELARFRAAFAALDETARAKRWMEERAQWVEWRQHAQAVRAELDAEFPPLDLDSPEHERQVQLRARVDAFRQRETFQRPPAAEPRNPQLEAAIDADVDADAPFLVYGDWLASHGSPRGELISLHAAARKQPRELEATLLGPLAGFVARLDARWRLGFLEHIRVEATRDDERDGLDLAQLVEKLWALPSARFLRELSIACASAHEDGVMARVLETLTREGRPSLRALTFETNTEEEMLSWTSTTELSDLGRAFPNLERLFVHAGQVVLSTPRFPRLRSLDLHTTSLNAELLSALAGAEWPALRHLGLWFGSRAYGVELSVDTVRPLLDASLPALKSLALANCEVTDELCAVLAVHPLVARLEALDLSMGTMTDAGAQALLAHRSRLVHLKNLDVDDNYLSADAVASLRTAFPQLTSNAQRVAEEYDGALHRYASVGE